MNKFQCALAGPMGVVALVLIAILFHIFPILIPMAVFMLLSIFASILIYALTT